MFNILEMLHFESAISQFREQNIYNMNQEEINQQINQVEQLKNQLQQNYGKQNEDDGQVQKPSKLLAQSLEIDINPIKFSNEEQQRISIPSPSNTKSKQPRFKKVDKIEKSTSKRKLVKSFEQAKESQKKTKVKKNYKPYFSPKQENLKKVPRSKEDLKQLEKLDRYRLLQIKNGEIRNKIGSLRDDLEKEYYKKKNHMKLPEHENVKSSDYYSLQNPRTIEAHHFVGNLQEKRRQEKRRLHHYMMMKREEQLAKKQVLKQEKRREKQDRKRQLEFEYHQRYERQQQQKELNKLKKQEIKQWSKIFQRQRPLYVKKQEEFLQNYIIPQIHQQNQRLMEIKLEHRPIDVEQLNQHDQRYMEFKRDDQIRKNAELEMMRERDQLHENQQQKYYKGSFRYNVLAEMIEEKNPEDPKEIERIKKARQIIYSDQINKKRMLAKKLQTLDTQRSYEKQFKKRTRKLDGSMTVDHQEQIRRRKDPRTEGINYLHFMKNLVQEKGVMKNPELNQSKLSQKRRHPDYLAELHEKRKEIGITEQKRSSIKKGNLQLDDLSELRAKAQKHEQKMRRNQLGKKHGIFNLEDDASLEKAQLSAVRAKLELMNHID